MNNELFQLLLSLKIGDGCYINQRRIHTPTYYVSTNSINLDYVEFKKRLLNKYKIHTNDYIGKSEYGSKKPIYGIKTRVEPEITIVGRMSVDEILDSLDIYGLILYYLDDGSLHKSKHIMNIYCNSFTWDETEHLINVIYKFFPSKRCTHLYDKKKDGRIFNYVYVNTCVTSEFSSLVREFLINNNINSLLYKTISPPQTIENVDK